MWGIWGLLESQLSDTHSDPHLGQVDQKFLTSWSAWYSLQTMDVVTVQADRSVSNTQPQSGQVNLLASGSLIILVWISLCSLSICSLMKEKSAI